MIYHVRATLSIFTWDTLRYLSHKILKFPAAVVLIVSKRIRNASLQFYLDPPGLSGGMLVWLNGISSSE